MTQNTPGPLSARAQGKKRSHSMIDDTPMPAKRRSSSTQLDRSPRPQHVAAPSTPPVTASNARTRGLFLSYIDQAFSAMRKNGDRKQYHELVAQFRPSQNASTSSQPPVASGSQLRSYLEALTHVVNQLDKSHSSLVEALIAIPWTLFPEDATIRSYVRFIGVLVSARPEHLKAVVETTVKSLRWNTGQAPLSTDESSPEITRRQIYDRCHILLRHCLDVVPTMTNILLPCIERNFPNKREKREAQQVYFRNVLQVSEYCPQIAENILDAAISRATKIDVEIQSDLSQFEDDHENIQLDVFGFDVEDPFDRAFKAEADSDDSGDEGDFPLDLDDISTDEEDDSDSDHTQGPESREQRPEVVARLKEMASKLDAILKVIFSHLETINSSRFSSPATRPPGYSSQSSPFPALRKSESRTTIVQSHLTQEEADRARNTQFQHLLNTFQRTILQTFKTRHVQFLIFWYASLSPDYADIFNGSLIEIALDRNDHTPTVMRLAACGYVASFISRARYIDPGSVRTAMILLCDHLELELQTLPAASSAAQAKKNIQQYAVFYAVCQAAMYIFCYRWRDLLLDDEDEELGEGDASDGQRKWLPELEMLKSAILSHLNPLKVCAPEVVTIFAKVSHYVGFAYCFNVIASNERSSHNSPTASVPTTPLASDSKAQLTLNMPAEDSRAPPASNAHVREYLQEGHVNTHFPFDPYKLPLTKAYIDHLFREYEPPEGMEEDETDEDESEAEAEDTRGLNIPGHSRGDSTGDLGLESMSIST